MRDLIVGELKKIQAAVTELVEDKNLHEQVWKIAEICSTRLLEQKKIIFAGNGGSAADAQHFAAELVSRLRYDRPGLSAIALTTDTSALTAIGNDYGFDVLFSRQVEAIGKPGDILFGISTSGNSVNILNAFSKARELGITTIGLASKAGGGMPPLCDYILNVPATETPKIQECHIILGHIICTLIEEKIFGATHNPKYQR